MSLGGISSYERYIVDCAFAVQVRDVNEHQGGGRKIHKGNSESLKKII